MFRQGLKTDESYLIAPLEKGKARVPLPEQTTSTYLNPFINYKESFPGYAGNHHKT